MDRFTKTGKNVNFLKPLVPLPTSEELAKLGGRYFIRPTDGRKLEYFVLNGGASKPAIVNIVTSSSTALLYHRWNQHKVLEILEGGDLQFINISTAGVGPSEPYGKSLGDIATTYLENTACDVLSLLRDLEVSDVYTMGIGCSWEPSAYLAAKLAARTKNPLLKGVCCIYGLPWKTKNISFWEKAIGKGMIARLTLKLKESPLAPYVLCHQFPKKVDLKMFKEEERERLIDCIGHETLLEEVRNVNRSVAYYLFVASHLGMLTCNSNSRRLPERYADISKLRQVPVHLHFSENDKMVPSSRVKAWLLGQLPFASEFNYKMLSHHAPPIEEALERLAVLNM